MTENICSQGHVIDFGKDICSRCNGRAIGQVEIAPVIEKKKRKSRKTNKIVKKAKKVIKKVIKKVKKAKK